MGRRVPEVNTQSRDRIYGFTMWLYFTFNIFYSKLNKRTSGGVKFN